MSLNLALIMNESAKRDPAKTAIIMDEKRMSYGELNAASNKVANALRSLGVQRGDKVAMMLPNVPQFPIVYYGILKLGATVVPLNVQFKAGEIQYHLEDSDAVALFTWEAVAAEAHKGWAATETCKHLIVVNAPGSDYLPDGALSFGAFSAVASPAFEMAWTMPDDTAVLLYTSGTTGRPKGAELTHFNMFYNAAFCADRLLGVTPQDVSIAALPLFHSFGQTCAMNMTFYAGATLTMLPRFEPEQALEIFQRDKVTIFAGVPTMYFYLLNYPDAGKYDVSSLRLCVSGGAAIPVEVMKGFERKYNVVILEGYGLSETSPVASFNVRERPRKPGSIGLPIWGTEMKAVDANDVPVPPGELGEIVIRGHNVMKGYYKRPEATAEAMKNGWFHTGDIARLDEDGYFFIVDRKKDMILRGGFNVYPREVEEVLYGHPAIAEAAVVGVPEEALGEEVKAFVVLKPGMSASEQEIIDYCKERMASFKYPRTVEFRESLPKGGTGKILKSELRG
ncbi:MAG: long-chain fatty acid--CoA ligase [Chloroflexota bacterium]